LGLDGFREWKDSLREELTTARMQYKPSALKSRIQASAEKGLVLGEDLRTTISLVDSERDLQDYKTLLERYVELNKTNAIVLTNAGKHIGNFYRLCHILRLPNAALGMFHSQVVDPSYINVNKSNRLLLDLLHKSGKHNDVLEVFNKIMEDIEGQVRLNFDLLTVVLLSLNKLGGDDAFSKATSALDTFFSKNTMEFDEAFGRGVFAYAHLASKAGEYSLAHDAIHNLNKKSILKLNIDLDILTKMGRLSDAVNLLHNMTVEEDVPGRMSNRKPVFCSDIIDSLVAALKEANDPELVEEVRVVFKRLDSTADIVSEDIEYFLNLPIRSSRASKRVEDEAKDEKNFKVKSFRELRNNPGKKEREARKKERLA